MTKFKKIDKYIYQYFKKYRIIQGGKTLAITDNIEDALKLKQQLFQQGVIRPKLSGPQRNSYENRYIHTTLSGTYQIRKSVNGEYTTFGTYKTIEAARDERNYLESIDWDYSNMETVESLEYQENKEKWRRAINE